MSYIGSKLAVLVSAQIRALRLKSDDPPMPHQRDLAREANLQQSRISMFETPGAANMTLKTLAKIAAGLRVGVIVKFVPFSDMLQWENLFAPDHFNVVRLSQDEAFLNPVAAEEEPGNVLAAQDFMLAAPAVEMVLPAIAGNGLNAMPQFGPKPVLAWSRTPSPKAASAAPIQTANWR